MVELMVALSILTVCGYLLSSTITATMAHRVAERETAAATRAIQNVFEDMRNEEFSELYALYNDDPNDDPGGAGTATGRDFAVEGLTPLPADADGFVGMVRLPSPDGVLREDAEDDELSLPRDLNGDAMIDEVDHAGDYIVLPVRVSVEWDGYAGPRRLEMFTMLADLEKL